MNTRILLATVLVICSSNPSVAQNQHEMNAEASRAAAKADKQLNIIYKKLLPTLDEEGQKLLRESQRAWVAFRDAEAALAADQFRGGSAAPLLYSGSLASTTEARIQQLKSYTEASGDEPATKAEPKPEPQVAKGGAKSMKEAGRRFFDAYKNHDRTSAQAVAAERALNKLIWSKDAGDNSTLQLMDDTHIYYEGGSIELKIQKNKAGDWVVLDVVSTAD
jgi:uncharacterized protein YecT (DUF1311 family)